MTTSAAPRQSCTISAVCRARAKSDEQITVPAGSPLPRAASRTCSRPAADSP